jgi:class 3 adenylate cyclase
MNPRKLPHTHSFDYEFRHPVEQVWGYVTNTDRINRAVGLPAPIYTHQPNASGGSVRHGAMTVLGFPLKWLEHPYEWVRHQYFWNQRDYLSGPLKANDICWEFTPTAKGCKVTQTFCFEAKNWVFTQIAHYQMGVTLKKNFQRSFAFVDDALDKHTLFPFPPTFPGDRALDAFACDALKRKLLQAGLNEAMANTLTELIARSPEPDLVRIRPFVWARRWNVDRLVVLRAFLAATKAGVLELSFTVSPTVRNVEGPVYCVGGPQNTPHYLTQVRLAPGQSVSLNLDMPKGVYRVRSLSSERSWQVEVSERGVPGPPLLARFEVGPERRTVRTELSSGKIELVNAIGHEVVALVEHAEWLEDACTAAFATSVQDFRDMFSSEVLKPGQELKVGAIALLFTDLRGSTSMYGRIGDAVMAAFSKPENAVKAAIDIHQRIDRDNRTPRADGTMHEPLNLKIGIHYGPCYAVNSNDRLDYFGTTVNIAARTEGQCEGGDIVISAKMMEQRAVEQAVRESGLKVTQITRALRGFNEHFELYRIECLAKAEGAALAPRF